MLRSSSGVLVSDGKIQVGQFVLVKRTRLPKAFHSTNTLLADAGEAVQNGARQVRRRGRPAGTPNKPKARVGTARTRRRKGGLSPEGRAAIVAAHKARWAAIKAKKKQTSK